MGDFVLVSHDDLKLSGYDWRSYKNPDSPRAVIILIHGLAEYSGRYANFADFYNKQDIAVVAMDLRGHGLSDGDKIFIPDVETIFQDIDLLIVETRNRYPLCPAILYGHSMGGNLALSYTYNRYKTISDGCPYQAVVVTAPWIRLSKFFQPRGPVHSIIQLFGRRHLNLKVPLKFNPRIITRNQQIVDDYATDPYIRRSITLSIASTMGQMARDLDRQSCSFTMPVLIHHGQSDRLTSHNASLSFAKRGKNIDFKSWPLCYHELHNEPDRENMFKYTLNWLEKKTFF